MSDILSIPFVSCRINFAGQLMTHKTARKTAEGFEMLENLLFYKDMVAFLYTQGAKSGWVQLDLGFLSSEGG